MKNIHLTKISSLPRLTINDVKRIVILHGSNKNGIDIINKYINYYDHGLLWNFIENKNAWLARKADAELNAPALPIETQDQQTIESPLFAEPEPVRPELKTIEQYRAEILINGISIDEYLFRTQRTAAVNSITVEVDGLVFDGDEQSQRRMLAAIHASEDAGIESTIWRLADNTEAAVTVEQIRQAHSLAIIEQGKLWTKGAADA